MSRADGTYECVLLENRHTENEVTERRSRDLDVLERAQDVDGAVGQHDARPRRVLDRELCAPALAGNAADGAREVVALEGLDIIDVECLDEEVVHTEQGHRVLHSRGMKRVCVCVCVCV